MKRIFFYAVFYSLFLLSCGDAESYKPNIIGRMGEVMLVMTEGVKTSQGGKTLSEMFVQEMHGLPQIEPLFSISTVPPTALTEHLKRFRNLLIVTVSPDVEKEGVKPYTKSTWASQQALMYIEAKNLDSFQEIVEKNEMKILGFFVAAERNRSLSYHKKYSNGELAKIVANEWGFNMVFPKNYKANKPKSGVNFKWFSEETLTEQKGVMLYVFDYKDEESLSRDYLLYMRDSTLRQNIPGSLDGSYMATETKYPVSYKTFTVNGHKTAELRGLWKTVGDFMGGPFVMFAHFDKANNRVVVTDGYVYAPQKPEKRNIVWQMESLFYSVKFPSKTVKEENTEDAE